MHKLDSLLLEGVPRLQDVLIANESDSVYKVLTGGEQVTLIVNCKTKPCSIWLDEDCLTLHLKRKLRDVTVDIAQLREVRDGFLTQGLLQSREKLNLQEEHVLSLIVQDKDERRKPITFDLLFENQLLREWWLSSLRTLLRAMTEWNGEAYIYLKPWLTHLKGKASLSARSALKLLRELRFDCSRNDVQALVNHFDADKDGRLNFAGTVIVVLCFALKFFFCKNSCA
jgi:hypothetical protein